MTKPTIQITITGYLVGPIWFPQGARAHKPFSYDLTNVKILVGNDATLVDHMERITNDADFQYCQIADGWLQITSTRVYSNGRQHVAKRTKNYQLSHFPSIADYLLGDWEGPGT